jgi:Endonuclease-reverse transcriptase
MLNCQLVVCGDFNAHFGDISNLPMIGSVLHQSPSNSNGQELLLMMEELELEALTTKDHNSTTLTWVSGGRSSQIDHVILPQSFAQFTSKIRGELTKFPTDHKLISFKVSILPLNLSLLSVEHIQEKFETYIHHRFNPENQSQLSVDQRWDTLCHLAYEAAHEWISSDPPNYDPKMAAAYGKLRAQLNKVNKLRVIDAASNYNDSNDSPPSLLPGELEQL